MRKCILPGFLFLLLMQGCGQPEPRHVKVPRSFLDSIGSPFIEVVLHQPVQTPTFSVTRSKNESVDLVLPAGPMQWTWLYDRGYLPVAGEPGDSTKILREYRTRYGEEMVYNLDTLADGRYVMGAEGTFGGYHGYFVLDLNTK